MLVFITSLAIIVGALAPFIVNPDLQQNTKIRTSLNNNWDKLMNLLLGSKNHETEIASSTKKLMEIAVVALLGGYVLLYTSPLIGLGIGVLFAFMFADEIKHFLKNNKLTAARFNEKSESAESSHPVIDAPQTAKES